MHTSLFNVQVPVDDGQQVFLMNTFSDAQLLVSADVTQLLERVARGEETFTADERAALDMLVENGFVIGSREQERASLDDYFASVRNESEQMKVTVLTTLQCNFACDYCFQGDHDDYNKFAAKMTLATAAKVAAWIERQLDQVRPRKFTLTLFGGEPLLNLPVAYFLAEQCHRACAARDITSNLTIITNGLLLTPEVVDRLAPFGLVGVKVTLDGDRHTHDRMRPLRGRQGTFDRIIENIRRVADKVAVTIGGNFDESSWQSYPALLEFLRGQEFADKIARINFKPIIKAPAPAPARGVIPLIPVADSTQKPLGGTCMTSAGAGKLGSGTSPCDSCGFVDEKMAYLREETRKYGFHTPDGVHMGPCEIHRRHAHTIGPDGSIYACPGFTGEPAASTGHIDGRDDEWRQAAARRFERLAAHKEECGDCSFIPVCGGGCSVAAHTELGDMHQPSCHKGAFHSAVITLAQRAAASLS